VLELMPGEANNLPLPPPLSGLDATFQDIDAAARLRRFDIAIEIADRVVVPPIITADQYRQARDILSKLITRRKTKHDGHH
jgi:hypothetical protein